MITVNTAGANDISNHIRALVCSSQGALASKWSSTAPNVLVASCGASMIPMATNGVKFVQINSEMDLFNLKIALSGTSDDIEAKFGFKIETLVIDCLDEFQRRILLERLKSQKRIDTNYEDWNWISQRLNAIYEGLNELDLNIITITHLTNIEDTSSVKPNIQGAFCTQIHNYVDYAFYLGVGENIQLESDVNIDVDGNEVTLTTEEIFTSAYIQTLPSSRAEWVHDNTFTLPRIIDLTFENDFDIILSARKNLQLSESNSININLDEGIEDLNDIKDIAKTVIKDDNIPIGMSSSVDIKSLIEKRKKQISST